MEIIASKKRLIDAHNEDAQVRPSSGMHPTWPGPQPHPGLTPTAAVAQASFDYLSAVIWNKETRKLEDLPGANTEICNGEMIADAGWDPLRLADTKTHLLVYREAEVKHGAC